REPQRSDITMRDGTLGRAQTHETSAPFRGGASRETRHNDILAQLRGLIARLLMLNPDEIDARQYLIEIAAACLILVEAITAIQEMFGGKLRMRQVFEELSTLDRIAFYLADAIAEPDLDQGFTLPDTDSEVDHGGRSVALHADHSQGPLELSIAQIME